MSGGKGGSTTSSVTIPEYVEEAARRNLGKAEGISQIGFTPYYGPDVAAFTPFQQAGFQQTADVAGAFGMATPTSQRDIMGGMARQRNTQTACLATAQRRSTSSRLPSLSADAQRRKSISTASSSIP